MILVKDTKLYDRLKILPNASESEIKKSYAILSKKWHPDKNLNNIEKANEKFMKINMAKEILLDNNKRLLYNKIGMKIFNTDEQSKLKILN
jgi:DnaJ-class molecular chaperone